MKCLFVKDATQNTRGDTADIFTILDLLIIVALRRRKQMCKMDEYIKRRDAIAPFIYDSNGNHISDTDCEGFYHSIKLNRVKEIIYNIPASLDFPVIQCKDCKNSKNESVESNLVYCEVWDRYGMPKEFFCGYGKENE